MSHRSTIAMLVGIALVWTFVPVAGQTDEVAAPEITNPAIRKIIESLASRVGALRPHLSSGALGQSNKAKIEVRDLSAVSEQDRTEVIELVRAQNADRERMFKEIAAATGADLSQLPRIRSDYAAKLRQKARRGDWIQMPDDEWRKKP